MYDIHGVSYDGLYTPSYGPYENLEKARGEARKVLREEGLFTVWVQGPEVNECYTSSDPEALPTSYGEGDPHYPRQVLVFYAKENETGYDTGERKGTRLMNKQITLAQWLEQCLAGTPPGNWFVAGDYKVEWEKRQTSSSFTISVAEEDRVIGAFMAATFSEEKANKIARCISSVSAQDLPGTVVQRG